jgi:hypothetical protein
VSYQDRPRGAEEIDEKIPDEKTHLGGGKKAAIAGALGDSRNSPNIIDAL